MKLKDGTKATLIAIGILFTAMLPHNTKAFELDPVCHEYYQVFQTANLTYDDAGRIADAMHDKKCWPAMQGLLGDTQESLDDPQESSASGDLPTCKLLANHVEGYDNIRKIFEVKPLAKKDCGNYADTKRPLDPRDLERLMRVMGVPKDNIDDVLLSFLAYGDEPVSVAECNLLVDNPLRLAEQRPDLGVRLVNCRGRVVYNDNSRAGLYFYMERYPDGEDVSWSREIDRW